MNKGNAKGRRERACRPEMSPAGDVGGGVPRWIDNLRVLPPGLLVVVVPTPCHTYKHPPPCEGGISRWHVGRRVDRCTGGGAVVSSSGRGTIRAGPLLAGPVPTKRPEGDLSKALRDEHGRYTQELTSGLYTRGYTRPRARPDLLGSFYVEGLTKAR